MIVMTTHLDLAIDGVEPLRVNLDDRSEAR
jgi:hypothetical protein